MTARCSTAEVTMCLPFSAYIRATPKTARLHDSVPPDVNTISAGFAEINAATCSRARSMPSSAFQPNACEREFELP